MFEPLYTAEEMRAAEQGHDVDELMERAGRGVAEEILRRFPDARRIAGVCGSGANGGDARIALRILREAGIDAVETDDFDGADVIVDGLLGTGLRDAPRDEAAARIEQINSARLPVVAVDVPSGVDASTGETHGRAVRAAYTVTFHGRKVGLEVAPGRFHVGTVSVVDIGLSHADETSHRLVTREALRLVPRRGPTDNKYTAGSVLVVGGSRGLTGAACLAAEAAFRADAGYVAVAAPAESLPVLEVRLLEAVKRPLEEVFDAVGRADALALGPGLGPGHESLVRRLLQETNLPAVVDADGLRDLEPFRRDAHTVLTPHEGELGRLLGEDSEWVAAHRLEALRRGVQRFGGWVVLLKGADTLVGTLSGPTLVVAAGPPSLATAGTGDVLTGVIAAFLAKGLHAPIAAAVGAVAQQEAASILNPQTGVVASDVVAALPEAIDAPL